MKKIIAIILVSLMLMSTAYAAATFECNSGEIGDRSIDNGVGGKISSFLYNGGTYSFTVNEEDFERLNQLFSDQNLTNSLKTFSAPMTGSMSDYPKGGKYIVKEVYDNEKKCSTTLEFSFDSTGVLLSEIVVSDVNENILRQGYYTYKNKDSYSEIKNILGEYAKNEEEKSTDEKYDIEENESKISDLKILYTATFSDSKLSVNGDNTWTWGICSYTYEKGKTVTRAYLSLLADKDIKYYAVSDIGLQKNNTVYFSGNTDILFYDSENFGKENTKSDILYSYKLQFNVSDDLKIEGLVYSQKNKLTNASQSIDIDMNNYSQNKTLPKISEFPFSAMDNMILQEDKTEANREDIKTEENENLSNDNELKETDLIKEEKEVETKEEQKKETFTFEDLTKISSKDIVKATITYNEDERIPAETSSPLIISDIINSFKEIQFTEDRIDGGGDGWTYFINFYMDNGEYLQFGTRLNIDKTDYKAADYNTTVEKMAYYHDLIKNIDSSEWATDYILESMELGYLEDMSELSYKDPITREKFCEIVYNMLVKTSNKGMEAPAAFYFEDTYNSKVSALYYADIIKGKGERKFAPGDYLTREEAATILYRVAEFMQMDMPQSEYNENIEYYSDKAMISDWAFNAVFHMKEMGIMIGTSDTEFSPQNTYIAEQAIATIIRLAEK